MSLSEFVITFLLVAFGRQLFAQFPNAHYDINEKKQGAFLYKKYGCRTCHGKNGKKIADLTTANKKYSPAQMKRYLMNPREFGNLSMPIYANVIKEEEYSSLIEYISTGLARPTRKNK